MLDCLRSWLFREYLDVNDRPGLIRLFNSHGITPPKIIEEKGGHVNARGGLPGVICISTGLLDSFTDEEAFAVALHEMGHKNTKFNWILYTPVIVYAVLLTKPFWELIPWIGPSMSANFSPYSLLFPVVGRLIMPPIIRYYNRKSEFEADGFAAETLGENREWLVSVLNQELSHSAMEKIVMYGLFWPFDEIHPSTEERIQRIKGA